MKHRLPALAPSPLPPLYARWTDELLGGPVPPEPRATCSACPMLPEAGATLRPGAFFDPRTKCCTYVPRLPNFLVGRALADEDTPGRASLEARIERRVAVSPLGLGVPASYALLYEHAAQHDAFGRVPDLRCPHFLDDGRCGVWRHRGAVCSTWFCRHERGLVGRDLFRRGLEPLLREVERDLSRYCALRLEVDPTAIEVMLPNTRDSARRGVHGMELGELDQALYAQSWGGWLGRERAFFCACAELVEPLAWADVVRIAGPTVQLLAALTRELLRRAEDPTLPARLRPGTFRVLEARGASVRVTSYSPHDAIDIPAPALALLPAFDGRPTRQVLRDHGPVLTEALVRQWVDFGILEVARE